LCLSFTSRAVPSDLAPKSASSRFSVLVNVQSYYRYCFKFGFTTAKFRKYTQRASLHGTFVLLSCEITFDLWISDILLRLSSVPFSSAVFAETALAVVASCFWCLIFIRRFFVSDLVVGSVPVSVLSLVRGASRVGFSGSRVFSRPASFRVGLLAGFLGGSVPVSVGCASGLDASVRFAFPSARVFFASSFGSGVGSFVRRSVAFVSSLPADSVLVVFPAVACPALVSPSASSSACFCGGGSGSWASLAFAVGLGVRCLVWLPAGLSVPSRFRPLSFGGGWWRC